MGYNFRKSINLGKGFKINLSKSGIGYSFKVPYGRVTKTASGKVNYNYTGEKLKGKRFQNKNSSVDTMTDIDSADIENFRVAEYCEIINKISILLWINRISNILILVTLFTIINLYFLIALAIGVIVKILIKSVFSLKLEYTLDGESAKVYGDRIKAWLSLNNCKKIWQVLSESKVANKKTNAGLSRNVTRKSIRILNKSPFYISTNVDSILLNLKKEILIMLPDKILIIRGCKAGAIDYDSLKMEVLETEFIEGKKAPTDAKIIDYRWKYSNKNGESDKRYKNNKKLPVYLYGVIRLTSEEGLNVEIQCSNVNIIDSFKKYVI